ncbi:hypothetical protein F5X96DRAFT_162243 [Biscogniauxia mediterranea]|nr:hypothetical protein F5X96DRAFT_162243 [Biscogniauxia mediterranea]
MEGKWRSGSLANAELFFLFFPFFFLFPNNLHPGTSRRAHRGTTGKINIHRSIDLIFGSLIHRCGYAYPYIHTYIHRRIGGLEKNKGWVVDSGRDARHSGTPALRIVARLGYAEK